MIYKIDYLGNQKSFIEELSLIWVNEWTPNPGESDFVRKVAKFHKRLSINKPPFIMVAYSEELLGSAGLFLSDLEKRTDYTPWLAGVFVKNQYRSRGIASDLVETIISKARCLGYKRIYLHTEKAQGFYEKIGWIHLEKTTNDLGEKTDIYYLDL